MQQLFWRLTLFWAVLCLGRAVATLWLLASTSVVTFVAAKSILTVSIAVLGRRHDRRHRQPGRPPRRPAQGSVIPRGRWASGQKSGLPLT